jgi:integrase
VIYWDTKTKGFGLRVTSSSMSYIAQARVAGKTVRTKIGAFPAMTPNKAEELAKAAIVEMAKGVNVNEEKREAVRQAVTLDQAYRGYIQERDLRGNTLRDYERAMNRAFDDWKGKPLTNINRQMVEKRFDELSQPTVNDAGEVVSKNEAFPNQAFRFLRALINWAREKYAAEDGEPLLPSNPCDRLKARKKWHKIARRDGWIRPDQLSAFFAALKQQPHHTERQKAVRDLCALYVLTGVRLNEGASLRWDLIDLKRKTLTIASERAKNHNKLELPLGEWLSGMLSRRHAANEGQPTEKRSGYVFPSGNKVGHLKDFADVLQGIATESGLSFTPHDLRRTFLTITNNHVKGLSAYTIKRLVNHAVDDTDVTAGYIVLDAEALREPMQQVESFMLKSAGVIQPAEVIDIRQAIKSA